MRPLGRTRDRRENKRTPEPKLLYKSLLNGLIWHSIKMICVPIVVMKISANIKEFLTELETEFYEILVSESHCDTCGQTDRLILAFEVFLSNLHITSG
jgi:hypothetical protein